MATLNQIAFNIAEASDQENNTVLINRVKFMVEYYRSLFLRRDAARGVNISDVYTQSVTYNLTQIENITDCSGEVAAGYEYIQSCLAGGDGTTSTSTLHVTTTPVPEPVNFNTVEPFISVTSVGHGQDFTFVNPEAVMFSLSSRWTAAMPKYYYLNGYIYVINAPKNCIVVRMVVESPTTGGTSCLSPDEEYPVSLDMVQRITQAILGTELRMNTSNDDEQVTIE